MRGLEEALFNLHTGKVTNSNYRVGSPAADFPPLRALVLIKWPMSSGLPSTLTSKGSPSTGTKMGSVVGARMGGVLLDILIAISPRYERELASRLTILDVMTLRR
ncbi:hypothetical protein DFH94DRAFT_857091 [Russula ochroleuca]|uniref:Uncharacterized protein n=1 Tax=Russula ochroleuca TaxID=152965 RepID=A0A9P5JXN3_9AGAM|nr:hypothetical protein DFH94DRAFT_857091 [Russula ochroleuca]